MSDYNLTKIVTGKRLELFLQARTIDDRQKLRNDCLRKVRFTTIMEAGKIARRVKKRDNKELYIYHCKHCKGYHLTSKKNRYKWANV